jgi:hypothetical protein
MEVGGISAPGVTNEIVTKQWRLGERLLVEVVNLTTEGEGTVRINGKDVSALLETSTQIGEKFWVKVGNTREGNLLLIREPNKQEEIYSAPQLSPKLIERGLPLNQEIMNLVSTFSNENLEGFSSILGAVQGTVGDEIIINLRKLIPEWGELSEENGAAVLLEFLRKIGLTYEQRIAQMQKLDAPARDAEKENLKDTIKYKLLNALENQDSQESEGNLRQLLQKITSQQLWYKTGTLDNAFVLLHLPLLNQGKLVPVKVGIESARKGPKMDEKHCRIAIQLETQSLGDVGIDAYFNQDSLFVRLLTRDTSFLSQLLPDVVPQTKKAFAKLGFNLEDVDIGDLDEDTEFQNFLKGSRRSGVDLER